MFILHLGTYPAIMCPITLETVVIFADSAEGFSKCIGILREVQDEIAEVYAMAGAMS